MKGFKMTDDDKTDILDLARDVPNVIDKPEDLRKSIRLMSDIVGGVVEDLTPVIMD